MKARGEREADMEGHRKTAGKKGKGERETWFPRRRTGETLRLGVMQQAVAMVMWRRGAETGWTLVVNLHNALTMPDTLSAKEGGKRRSNGVPSCHQIIKMSINKAGGLHENWREWMLHLNILKTENQHSNKHGCKTPKKPLYFSVACV